MTDRVMTCPGTRMTHLREGSRSTKSVIFRFRLIFRLIFRFRKVTKSIFA